MERRDFHFVYNGHFIHLHIWSQNGKSPPLGMLRYSLLKALLMWELKAASWYRSQNEGHKKTFNVISRPKNLEWKQMERQLERRYSKYTQEKQMHTRKTTRTLTDYAHNIMEPMYLFFSTGNISAYLHQYKTSKTYSQKAALDWLYQTSPLWHNQQVFQDMRSYSHCTGEHFMPFVL